jgi:predicted CXXCH cytochrome family protein
MTVSLLVLVAHAFLATATPKHAPQKAPAKSAQKPVKADPKKSKATPAPAPAPAATPAPAPAKVQKPAKGHDAPAKAEPAKHAEDTPKELNCKSCHDGFLDFKNVHPAVEWSSCDACHQAGPGHTSGDDSSDIKTEKSSALCFGCHDAKEEGKSNHKAMTEKKQCLNCHDPHGSDVNYLLRDEPRVLCAGCHKDVVPEGSKSVHGVMASGESCLHCHDPHSSPNDALLKNAEDKVCTSCHNKEIKMTSHGRPRVLPNIVARLALPNPHAPADGETSCINCHMPHAGVGARLLNKPFTENANNLYVAGDDKRPNPYGMCFDCHDQALLKEKMTGGETGFRNDVKKGNQVVRQNLHWFHVVNAAGSDNKEMGRGCQICHDAHGAEQPHIIRAEWRVNPKFAMKIVFKNLENGGECTKSCHTAKGYTRIE